MVDAWLLQESRLGDEEVGLWGIANISSNNSVRPVAQLDELWLLSATFTGVCWEAHWPSFRPH